MLPIMERSRPTRRFTKADPCPICGGHDGLTRGHGVRCFGYYSRDGWARCTREEFAGGLAQNRDGTYSHRPSGRCRCGRSHGPDEDPAPPREGRAAGPGTLKRRAEQRFRSFATLRGFLRRRYGAKTRVRHWVYRTAAGQEAFRVLRVDYRAPDGAAAKSYRPCHQLGDGRWRLARPDGALPLYNLPALLAAAPGAIVVVLEGEKCADLAAGLGLLPVTTSAHGARAPWLSDWTPLAGRAVALIGDADADGRGYVAQIAALLAALDPPAPARIVTLPGLAPGEDIEQWIDHGRRAGRGDAELLAALRALIEAAR